jgi:hypothetical protein
MIQNDQSQSLIFNWTPGIGDPTPIGWITVALYFLASFNTWRCARIVKFEDKGESRAWQSISLSFLALGINKQLDLQTAFTELGRVIAHYQGWYEQRQSVQLLFIVLVAAICLVVTIVLLIWVRKAPPQTWVGLIGTMMVLGYVLIRAASFHHVDRFIGSTVLGLRWNWLIEITGILLVAAASQWRSTVASRRATALRRSRTSGFE